MSYYTVKFKMFGRIVNDDKDKNHTIVCNFMHKLKADELMLYLRRNFDTRSKGKRFLYERFGYHGILLNKGKLIINIEEE